MAAIFSFNTCSPGARQEPGNITFVVQSHVSGIPYFVFCHPRYRNLSVGSKSDNVVFHLNVVATEQIGIYIFFSPFEYSMYPLREIGGNISAVLLLLTLLSSKFCLILFNFSTYNHCGPSEWG